MISYEFDKKFKSAKRFFVRILERCPQVSLISPSAHTFIITHLSLAITYLKFGDIFDKNVDYLPLAVKYVEFGRAFDQHVDHLPLLLTHLRFRGNRFNQYLDNLPHSLIWQPKNYVVLGFTSKL